MISFVSDKTAGFDIQRITFPVPQVLAGDFMLAIFTVSGGNSTVITAPTGWTLITVYAGTTNTVLWAYSRVATASEPDSYTWQLNHSMFGFSGGITAYRGVSGVHAFTTTPYGVAVPFPVTTTVNNCLIVCVSSPDWSETVDFAPTSDVKQLGTQRWYQRGDVSTVLGDFPFPIAGATQPQQMLFGSPPGVSNGCALTVALY